MTSDTSSNSYYSVSVFILHNECHPPPAILLDDAVEHTGKVDLRWQQLEVIFITEFIGRRRCAGDLSKYYIINIHFSHIIAMTHA